MAGQVAALAYLGLILGTILFQLALIAGAPWGRLTQGGTHPGALPRAARVGAAVSVGVLATMALSVLSAAGLWPQWPGWTGWATLALQGVSVVLNLITPSAPERRLWGPVTLVMLGLAGIVVLGRAA